MPLTEYEIKSGAQAVIDVAQGLTLGAAEAMQRHGNDPNGAVILTAGFVMAIETISREIDSTFTFRLIEQLRKS
jgi:hypothetical protein